jgi:hypothetical protein
VSARHTEAAATALCETWNWHYPEETPVLVVRDMGNVLKTTTRSTAWLTPSGGILIKVNGIAGGYSLSRVIPIPKS